MGLGLIPFYPHERAGREQIEEGHEVATGHVDAAVGVGAPQGGFIAEAMDVNVAFKGIHISALVEAGFEAFQP